MKPNETPSRAKPERVSRQSHAATFSKVIDGRKQPIRGLWQRGDRFYAQLTIEDAFTGEKKTRRVPLTNGDDQPVQSVAEARDAMARLKVKRDDNTLPVLKRTPKFNEYARTYLEIIKSGVGTKKSATISKEECNLKLWAEHLGSARLDKIKRAHVNTFITKRLTAGLSPRTCNLDVITLRNVLKRAVEDGWIQMLPTVGLRPLKFATPKRPLFTSADIDRVCHAAFEKRTDESGKRVPVTKNAQQFCDYIHLMAYSGARMREALALRWADVETERGQLTIGADGDTKNSTSRVVDFNPKLKVLLLEMKERCAPDSKWLFPSPQRGEKDIPAMTFRESLDLVKVQAGMPDFHFHDCRHFFVSFCVMSGIDYMTIAAWVGHRDGGVLIGKVYGHLANEHRKAMAGRVNFGPTLAAMPQAATA